MSTGTKTVVDYYGPHGADFMACLTANGVAGIARYLTNGARDPRQITPQEIADAHAAGLEVLFFYEMNPTFPQYFTFAQGAEDCRQAIDRLRELGAPAGTVVYFTVDTNLEPSLAVEYFNGVESMRTPQIIPGLYGFERMVEFARREFPHIGQHLAQTYGTRRGPLDLWQHEQLAMCGVAVDINECSVGGWVPPQRESPVANTVPLLEGQSPDLQLRTGQVGELKGVYRYGGPTGPERTIVRKVLAGRPGRTVISVYPPVDPDADETQVIDAEPAIFVVDVLPPA